MVATILCPLSGAPENKLTLDMAYSVVKDLKCHLEVMHVEPEAKESIPLLGEGMSVAMVEDMIRIAETEASQRAARAKKMFDDSVAERVEEAGKETPNKPNKAARNLPKKTTVIPLKPKVKEIEAPEEGTKKEAEL